MFLGRSPGELVGMHIFQLLPPLQARVVELKLKDCLEHRNTKFKLDFDIISKDGATENLSAIAISGKLFGQSNIHHPVYEETCPELKRKKELAGTAAALYEAIVEGAPDPIFIQTEHRFAYLNPAACAFFRRLFG